MFSIKYYEGNEKRYVLTIEGSRTIGTSDILQALQYPSYLAAAQAATKTLPSGCPVSTASEMRSEIERLRLKL